MFNAYAGAEPVELFAQFDGSMSQLQFNRRYWLRNTSNFYKFTLNPPPQLQLIPTTSPVTIDMRSNPDKNSIYVLMFTGCKNQHTGGLVLHEVEAGVTVAADFGDLPQQLPHSDHKEGNTTNNKFGYSRGKWDVMPMSFGVGFLLCVALIWGYIKKKFRQKHKTI